MIATSTICSAIPFPGLLIYSSTKRFVTHLAQGLNFELSDNVDVMSFNPGEVTTKLVMKDESEAKGTLITVEKATSSCFRDLGYTDMTNGALVHEMNEFNFLIRMLKMKRSSSSNLNGKFELLF